MTSPRCRASAAAESWSTLSTTTPFVEAGTLTCCAISGVSVSTVTPFSASLLLLSSLAAWRREVTSDVIVGRASAERDVDFHLFAVAEHIQVSHRVRRHLNDPDYRVVRVGY